MTVFRCDLAVLLLPMALFMLAAREVPPPTTHTTAVPEALTTPPPPSFPIFHPQPYARPSPQVPLMRGVALGVATCVSAVLLSVAVDSSFWGRWVWPGMRHVT
jgi:hypothetical protein